MKSRIIALTLLLATSAVAQQQPQATPSEQALSDRLLSEIQSNVQARTQLIEMQRQLTAAQTRVKALEDKYEPKKDVPK